MTPIYETLGSGTLGFTNETVVSSTQLTVTALPAASDPSETACITTGVGAIFMVVKAPGNTAQGAAAAGSPCTDPNGYAGITVQIVSDSNKICQAALATANKSRAAVKRAENAWSVLQTAADDHYIDPALLAAIGVRETGFMNVPERLPNGQEGPGMGYFQLTNRPGVTPAQAYDLTFAANYAANMLSTNMNILSNKFPAFTPDQLLQATAASYNFGTPNISGNPNTIDVGTAPGGIHGNYGSNVVDLMSCFQQP